MTGSPPLCALQRTDPDGQVRWWTFQDSPGVLEAWRPAEVLPVLREAERCREAGLHAVGWIAYEAAPGFDPGLRCHAPDPALPLLRFRLFRRGAPGLPRLSRGAARLTNLQASLTHEDFHAAVFRIRDAIARGETYQVNFTYPWEGQFEGDAHSLFRQLRFAQASDCQAYLEEEDHLLISASPERFFRLEKGRIRCRPMKGTAPRGEDAALRASGKNRAENLMIVDMLRNDLGKIADLGSVQCPALFEVESYPSLLQMTSTVTATGPESAVDWLCVLFPCASITGAPKRKTMEWIHQLESGPRGVYTGCIGGFYADGVTEFNVAIRTLLLERKSGRCRFHSGCGIVWDSCPEAEYAESQLKAEVLKHEPSPYTLFETMRVLPGVGIPLRERHLSRLRNSAAVLGFEWEEALVSRHLQELEAAVRHPSRLRLMLERDGTVHSQLGVLPEPADSLTFCVDDRPTPSEHPELSHKTTRRRVYEAARARHPQADETLLWNERGECMEFSIGNLVIEVGGEKFTPPLASGLLPGTARAEALARGEIHERVVNLNTLRSADRVYLLNAIRGLIPMRELNKPQSGSTSA